MLLALLAGLLVACGSDGGDGAAEEPLTIDKGTLTVGFDGPYRPLLFGEAARPRGFTVDVVNEVARRLELTVEFRRSPAETIFEGLEQERFDMVVSAVPTTRQSERVAAFSDPYFVGRQALTTRRRGRIAEAADLDGRTVGAKPESAGAAYAEEETEATLRTFAAIDEAFGALARGEIDAVLSDVAVARLAARSRPRLRIAERLDTTDFYGFAFARSSDELLEMATRALRAMLRDGSYTRIYRKWFREDPPAEMLNAGAEGPAGD